MATNTAPVIQNVKRIVSSMLPQFDATSVHHHGDQKWKAIEPIVIKNILKATIILCVRNNKNS